MEPLTDGTPLILKSELPITREVRGCSLGLMESSLIFKPELPITRELREEGALD